MPASSRIDLLTGWMPRQRWYTGKGRAPALRIIGTVELAASAGVHSRIHLVMDERDGRSVLYQVPVAERREPLSGGEAALIGVLGEGRSEDDDGLDGELVEPRYLYDGPRDAAFAEALLALIVDDGHATGDRADAHGRSARPFTYQRMTSAVLDGEQSNTSIVYRFDETASLPRLICKVFRALHHGENPDVTLQQALFEAGSTAVPQTIGSLVGEWNDRSAPGGRATGHLAFAQEFLVGAEDAWRLALGAAARGAEFTPSARAIGSALAEVHVGLRSALTSQPAEPEDIAAMGAAWARRLDEAIEELPELAPLRERITAVYARAAASAWPPLQRIHGDLHLGQVLSVAGGSWAIIDFEGEPARPLPERSRPDVALRDVAGMLRSFDYVAGAVPGAPDGHGWAERCREAFLEGYRSVGGDTEPQALLDALELDKALYETVYEARNRPEWLPIPAAAVRRLVSSTAGAS
ncbi:phosphotransferase [Microbacterium sp. STN6]|uniref:maltokinase N-terminal cap-like domain-containing protein n=1 Tax=Microbacterium sp. STN6 TaxID=2995588 RepID=UPI002260959E|nr:phosphotransferase [Microbacterium sp. STN6]MCX7521665.1 phosphotransferase [Microbacterium sp. STN6]